ncbi:MAG: hypothetical protein CMP48_13560 [Rickettsiales bacterium]|nr:hypothetical protein [Rickettsiales bacterium]
MNKLFFLIITSCVIFTAAAQTTTTDGSWQNSSNWNATYPGSGTDADGTLNLSGETINFDNYIILGSSSSRVNISVAGSNENGDFVVNDTLVIFGDVTFANKAMPMTVTGNGVLIIFGNLTMQNKISVASDGLIVVTGDFGMTGSAVQSDYSGAGNVYAGSYSGNAESEIDASGDGNGDSSFTIDDLSDDGFSTIEDYVTGGGTIPLPVEFLFFQSSTTDYVKLTWATASEKDNDRFEVERSDDGEFFYSIGDVQGSGTVNERVDYSFVDFSAIASVSYYRLKQVDFDGVYEYSQTIRVETGVSSSQVSFQVYPTVVTNDFMTINANRSFEVKNIEVFGLSGNQQGKEVNFYKNHPSEIEISGNNLQKGIYLIRLTTTEGDLLVQRFIVR